MDGSLYMNVAGYYHGLPGEQGNPLETSLSFGMGIYANWPLPICCMFTVQESNIVDSTVMITRRTIEEFRCADGWIGIVRHSCFEGLLDRKTILKMTFPNTAPCSHIKHAVKIVKKRGPTHQPSSGVARKLPPQLIIF